MRRFACVMLVCGCASPEPRILAETTITADEAHVTSSGAVAYELTFAAAGQRLPEALMFNGDNWIVGGATCPDESGVGVNLYPAFRAVAPAHGGDPASATEPSTLTVELKGPAIARVRMHWAIDYACESHANLAHGDLVMTLFPSGRIVRRDERVSASSSPLTTPNQPCGCSQASDYYFTSSWAFPDGAGAVDAQGVVVSRDIQQACAILGQAGIAVAWPDAHTRIHPLGANAYVYDWVREGSSVNAGDHELTTTMQLGMTGSCATLLEGLAMPDLQIAGKPAVLDEDGIYTVTGTHTGTFSIASASAVPAGWAIALDLGDAEHVKVTGAADPSDGWFVVEPDPILERTLIYFRDALPAGTTLTVEAE